jgi:isoleucyl-tRNA synthetase
MTRWIAPILSFTADEVWENLPGEHAELGVFTATWYEGLFDFQDSELSDEVWDQLLAIREQNTAVLEKLRQDGKIGSSLDADVTVYCDEGLLRSLEMLSEELRFILITSEATLAKLEEAPDGVAMVSLQGDTHEFAIQAVPSEHAKCVRCWHHRPEVGSLEKHPELCGRCVDNVDGEGETRQYA